MKKKITIPMIIEKFLTYQQLLDKLANDKDLIINDLVFAEEKLKEYGYFNIIGGYKIPFTNPSTRKYVNNTTFDDIYALYQFDIQLKKLFLSYLCQIERRVAVSIAYAFCEEHGNAQQYIYGKRDLFSLVIAFRYLLPKKDFIVFKRELADTIAKYLKSSNRLGETELFKYMGFPINWKSITRYKI